MNHTALIIGLTAVTLMTGIAWRLGGDSAGLPGQLIFDTPRQPLLTRRPHPAGTIPFGQTERTAPTGRELYTRHCAHCHGQNGDGQSYVSHYPGMSAVGNLQTNERSNDERYLILQEGRAAMPAFRHRLSPAELRELRTFLPTLLHQP